MIWAWEKAGWPFSLAGNWKTPRMWIWRRLRGLETSLNMTRCQCPIIFCYKKNKKKGVWGFFKRETVNLPETWHDILQNLRWRLELSFLITADAWSEVLETGSMSRNRHRPIAAPSQTVKMTSITAPDVFPRLKNTDTSTTEPLLLLQALHREGQSRQSRLLHINPGVPLWVAV